MRFSEADTAWQPVPSWVDYLIRCGFTWGQGRERRRIGVVSMPCESAGAGLLALGALRYRLTLDDANDSLSHFDRIRSLAARRDVDTILVHDRSASKKRYRLEGKDPAGWVWARRVEADSDRSTQSGPPRVAIHAGNANEWRLDREAPTETVEGDGLPYGRFYKALIAGAVAPLELNLTRSDSAICIAGRVAGEPVSRAAFGAVRFECEDQTADLAGLLTVHRWSPGTVSRVTFFNSRTGQFDRNAGSTRLVVADGDAAFLRAIDEPAFRQSDVLGVIYRVVERERLETIGTKLAELSQQWYERDGDMRHHLPPAPIGITVSVLKRRHA